MVGWAEPTDLRKMPLTLTQARGGRVRLPPRGARKQVWLEQRRKARPVALGNSGNTRPSDLIPGPCFRLRPERVDIIGHPTFLHPADEQFGRELPHRVWTEFPHHVWIEAIYLHEAELESRTGLFPCLGHRTSEDLLDNSAFPIHKVTPGLLGHELHKTLGRLPEALEKKSP